MKRAKIAITKNKRDYLRIIPCGSSEEEVEFKFSFIEKDSFIIRKFEQNTGDGLMLYLPTGHGLADNEITYHNANEWHPHPKLLPKHKDDRNRIPISQKIINLNLKNLIAPIPICRITINEPGEKVYQEKSEHLRVDLEEYYTTEIYIAPANYKFGKRRFEFPIIMGSLFLNTTIDYLLHGAGFGAEPIFEKMQRQAGPVAAFTSTLVGDYTIFYKAYNLNKTDRLLPYFSQEYSKKNIIEFFDNIEYLDLLATTNVSFPLTEKRNTPPKPAFVFDLDHLKKIGAQTMYVRRLEKRFRLKDAKYKRLKN